MSSADATLAPTLLRGAVFHYGRLLANGYRALHEVTAALEAAPDESVLDLGCGTGGFCHAAPGDYLGIDFDPGYVAFARWRWGTARRRFEVADVAELAGRSFDKAIMVNCLHHLSDAQARTALGRLTRLVRRRLVVVDADPEPSNWLQAVLLAYDRGGFVRPRAVQRALLAEHFRVVGERQFRNTPRTLVQTLFVCEPIS